MFSVGRERGQTTIVVNTAIMSVLMLMITYSYVLEKLTQPANDNDTVGYLTLKSNKIYNKYFPPPLRMPV